MEINGSIWLRYILFYSSMIFSTFVSREVWQWSTILDDHGNKNTLYWIEVHEFMPSYRISTSLKINSDSN